MLEFALFVGLLRGSYSTGTVWIVGLFANLLLAPAVLAGTQIVLEKWFQKHEAEGNRDFEAWEEQWTKSTVDCARSFSGISCACVLPVSYAKFRRHSAESI